MDNILIKSPEQTIGQIKNTLFDDHLKVQMIRHLIPHFSLYALVMVWAKQVGSASELMQTMLIISRRQAHSALEPIVRDSKIVQVSEIVATVTVVVITSDNIPLPLNVQRKYLTYDNGTISSRPFFLLPEVELIVISYLL